MNGLKKKKEKQKDNADDQSWTWHEPREARGSTLEYVLQLSPRVIESISAKVLERGRVSAFPCSLPPPSESSVRGCPMATEPSERRVN
jgi:hypothetical protein